MTTDSNIKTAMNEIKAVMERHDLGGCVILSGKNQVDWADVKPSWCSIEYHNPNYMRLRLPSKSDPKTADLSLGHMLGMERVAMNLAAMYLKLCDHIRHQLKNAGIEYTHEGEFRGKKA